MAFGRLQALVLQPNDWSESGLGLHMYGHAVAGAILQSYIQVYHPMYRPFDWNIPALVPDYAICCALSMPFRFVWYVRCPKVPTRADNITLHMALDLQKV